MVSTCQLPFESCLVSYYPLLRLQAKNMHIKALREENKRLKAENKDLLAFMKGIKDSNIFIERVRAMKMENKLLKLLVECRRLV